MSAHVATIEVPEDLVQQLDATFDAESRSNFVAESLRAALQRHRLRKFFESDKPAWKDEDHPDIAAMGSAEWVRALRRGSERHFPVHESDESSTS